MSYELVNNSHCPKESLKTLPDGWTSHQNKSINFAFVSVPFNLRLATSLLVMAIAILVISGVILWITKYKLQYLFRISIFLFIYSTVVLLIPFDLYIISFFISKYQESLVLLILHRRTTRWVLSTAFCFMMGVLRYHWALPLNIIKDSRTVGFSHFKGRDKYRRRTVKELSEKMLRHRERGQLNPVYVNGWIPLIDSREVVQGKVMSVIAVGYKFCVYRGINDQVFVMDAYCPHLGADFSAGGKVIGNCMECPFHGWQFSGETGKCVKIPYSQKIPDIAKVKVWESCERNGYVFVWHHAEEEPPVWQMPAVPQIQSGEWVYRGRSEFTVHCHIQEIPENGADIAHLPQVHSQFVVHGPCLENSGPEGHWIKHDWEPQWEADENEPHIARVKILQRLIVKGFEIPFSRITMNIQQIGPATVYLYMESEFGNGILLQYITTEEPMLQRVVQELYTEPRMKPAPASFLIWGEAVMIERDIAVWNNKKFLKNPLLVKEDKLILKFRRWFSQFYSEHSPTLKDLRQKTLDW